MRRKHIFKIRKAFNNVLISYLLILLLPVTAGIILSVNLSKMNEERIVEEAKEQVAAGLNNFYVGLEQLDMICVQIFNNVDLWKVRDIGIPQEGTTQILEVMDVAEKITSYRYALSEFQNFALILNNGQVYTTGAAVFGLEHYYSEYMGYAFPDFETWKYNSFSKKYVGREFYAYERKPLKGLGEAESVGLVYQYAPGINLVEGEREEVIQCLFTREKLSQYFNALLSIEGSTICIYDKEGNLLIALGEADFSSMDAYVRIQQSFDEGNYDVVTYIPRSYVREEQRSTQLLIVVLMGLILVVEVALGLFFSWKYSRPIKNLIRNIDNMRESFIKDDKKDIVTPKRKTEEVNEYQYLTDSVDLMLKTQRIMKQDLDSHVKQNQEHFYEDVFRNQYLNEEEITEAAAGIKLELRPQRYCVAVLSGLTPAALEEALSDRSHVVVILSMNPQFVTVLWKFSPEDTEETIFQTLKEQLERVNERLCSQEKHSCNIGIGKIYEKMKQIHFSYVQAQYAALKNSQYRENGLLFYADLSGMDAFYYPPQLSEKLINAAQNGNEKLVDEIFGEIEEENMNRRSLSKQMYEILFSNLCASLITIYSDVVAKDEVNQIIARCQEQRADAKEQLRYIRECFQKVCEESKEKETDMKVIFTEYVNRRYMDPQMGISLAAEEFNLSESYFSKYFKETMGDVFSTYLEKVRMEKARTLLKETEDPIQEISEKVGYGNSNTFRRAFQRIYGVSPSDWRKK